MKSGKCYYPIKQLMNIKVLYDCSAQLTPTLSNSLATGRFKFFQHLQVALEKHYLFNPFYLIEKGKLKISGYHPAFIYTNMLAHMARDSLIYS